MPPKYKPDPIDVGQVSIAHVTQVPFDMYKEYWDDMIASGRLKYRLCDSVNPSWDQIGAMFQANGNNMYFAMADGKPFGEFMLNNFTGKSAQIHFSVHPTLHVRKGIPYVRETVRQVLDWKVQNKPNEYYLHTLVGLTPVSNRAACVYVLRVGFVKQFILPAGIADRGKIVDAMVSTCTRENLNGR